MKVLSKYGWGLNQQMNESLFNQLKTISMVLSTTDAKISLKVHHAGL
jgi:hypothetical protein